MNILYIFLTNLQLITCIKARPLLTKKYTISGNRKTFTIGIRHYSSDGNPNSNDNDDTASIDSNLSENLDYINEGFQPLTSQEFINSLNYKGEIPAAIQRETDESTKHFDNKIADLRSLGEHIPEEVENKIHRENLERIEKLRQDAEESYLPDNDEDNYDNFSDGVRSNTSNNDDDDDNNGSGGAGGAGGGLGPSGPSSSSGGAGPSSSNNRNIELGFLDYLFISLASFLEIFSEIISNLPLEVFSYLY